MKTNMLTVAFFLTSIFLFSQEKQEINQEGTTITITVSLRGSGGHILIGLHSKETFMKKEALQRSKSEIKEGKATVTFTNVTPGTYGIMVLHDKNDNGQMDFDATGMPQESYGISNNVISFGPPQWEDAKFEVEDKPMELEIRI